MANRATDLQQFEMANLSYPTIADRGGVAPYVTAASKPVPLTRWQTQLADAPVETAYFGMHIHRATTTTPWPKAVSFGTWRLWDSNVAWMNLEPVKGQWNFTVLDSLVKLAAAHNQQIILPLALTPQWASARPNEVCNYGLGCAAEPTSLADWQNYVRTVTARYKGKIAYYEMWNETNLAVTWTGTPQDLVTMQEEAYTIMKQNDPNSHMISANVTGNFGLSYLKTLLELGYANSADIIGFHFYVSPSNPEMIAQVAASVESLLTEYGVDKPLWNTETGWHPPAVFASEDAQASTAVRAMVVARSAGVSRFLWYAWDNHAWVNLFMTEKNSVSLTLAARAYGNLGKWLIGNTLSPCTAATTGLWSCQLLFKNGQKAEILWSAANEQTVTLDSASVDVQDMYGNARTVTTGSILVGPDPVLVLK